MHTVLQRALLNLYVFRIVMALHYMLCTAPPPHNNYFAFVPIQAKTTTAFDIGHK